MTVELAQLWFLLVAGVAATCASARRLRRSA